MYELNRQKVSPIILEDANPIKKIASWHDEDITPVLVIFLYLSLFLNLAFSFIIKLSGTSVVIGKFTL